MKENSLWRTNANGIEHIFVRHGQHNSFNELLNLFFASPNVLVVFGRFFINLPEEMEHETVEHETEGKIKDIAY